MLVQTSSLSDPFAKPSGSETTYTSSGAQGKNSYENGGATYTTETNEVEEVNGKH